MFAERARTLAHLGRTGAGHRDLLVEYERKWLNQCFVSWEHEEERKRAGREAFTRF